MKRNVTGGTSSSAVYVSGIANEPTDNFVLLYGISRLSTTVLLRILKRSSISLPPFAPLTAWISVTLVSGAPVHAMHSVSHVWEPRALVHARTFRSMQLSCSALAGVQRKEACLRAGARVQQTWRLRGLALRS